VTRETPRRAGANLPMSRVLATPFNADAKHCERPAPLFCNRMGLNQLALRQLGFADDTIDALDTYLFESLNKIFSRSFAHCLSPRNGPALRASAGGAWGVWGGPHGEAEGGHASPFSGGRCSIIRACGPRDSLDQ
jgi:hypothetical protein